MTLKDAKKMSEPIVVVGSINVDLVATAARLPHAGETISGEHFGVYFGGKGANQAVAIARLGYPISMIGKVGNDNFGPELRGSEGCWSRGFCYRSHRLLFWHRTYRDVAGWRE